MYFIYLCIWILLLFHRPSPRLQHSNKQRARRVDGARAQPRRDVDVELSKRLTKIGAGHFCNVVCVLCSLVQSFRRWRLCNSASDTVAAFFPPFFRMACVAAPANVAGLLAVATCINGINPVMNVSKNKLVMQLMVTVKVIVC